MFKFELFHRHFTSFYSSREIWTQNIDLVPNVRLHISVGGALHRYHGGHGFESHLRPDFFRLLLSNCLNWKKHYCYDHSSLSCTTAVQIWLISYTLYITSLLMADMHSVYWPRSHVWLYNSDGRELHRYCGGHGFESRWSPDFFRLPLPNCLNWKQIYCDDHSSLSSTTAVQIRIISYILIYLYTNH